MGSNSMDAASDGVPGELRRHEKFLALHDHQVDAIDATWKSLFNETPTHGKAIIHDTGLGKTVTALVLLALVDKMMFSTTHNRPRLIVFRGSAGVDVWKREFSAWCEPLGLQSYQLDSSVQMRDRIRNLEDWENYGGILFSNIHTVVSMAPCGNRVNNNNTDKKKKKQKQGDDVDVLAKLRAAFMVVVDEIGDITQQQTRNYEVISSIPTPRKIVLTGTLFQNGLSNVYNILRLVAGSGEELLLRPLRNPRVRDSIITGLAHSAQSSEVLKMNSSVRQARACIEPFVHIRKKCDCESFLRQTGVAGKGAVAAAPPVLSTYRVVITPNDVHRSVIRWYCDLLEDNPSLHVQVAIYRLLSPLFISPVYAFRRILQTLCQEEDTGKCIDDVLRGANPWKSGVITEPVWKAIVDAKLPGFSDASVEQRDELYQCFGTWPCDDDDEDEMASWPTQSTGAETVTEYKRFVYRTISDSVGTFEEWQGKLAFLWSVAEGCVKRDENLVCFVDSKIIASIVKTRLVALYKRPEIVLELSGLNNDNSKAAVVREFQSKSPRILLCMEQSSATSLSFTSAHIVIHLSFHYNHSRAVQGDGRCFRAGQRHHRVISLGLQLKTNLEDSIVTLGNSKAWMDEKIIHGRDPSRFVNKRRKKMEQAECIYDRVMGHDLEQRHCSIPVTDATDRGAEIRDLFKTRADFSLVETTRDRAQCVTESIYSAESVNDRDQDNDNDDDDDDDQGYY